MLGAQGANIGTRFLASDEAAAADAWKQAILASESEDAIRFEAWEEIMPPANSEAYATVPRVLSTTFIETWRERPEDARQHAEQLRGEIMAAVREGRSSELLPFTGQSAGIVHDILPAAEIVRQIVAEAEQALWASVTHVI